MTVVWPKRLDAMLCKPSRLIGIDVQQDLALYKADLANAWCVKITRSVCMVRRTSRIQDCGNTAAKELMRGNYAMIVELTGPDYDYVLL